MVKKELINSDRLVRLFCELVAIDSPSYHEEIMCATLKERLETLGLAVTQDDAGRHYHVSYGNLLGFLPGSAGDPAKVAGSRPAKEESVERSQLPPLLFCCHMDTVVPAIGKKAMVHEDGTITSDGSTVLGADDVAGIVSILEALQILQEHHLPHRPLEILFTMSEEVYSRGMLYFDMTKLRSQEGYTLDLTGPVGTAAYAAPSIVPFTVVCKGRAAHAGFAPESGVHAIAMSGAAISRLPLGHVDEGTTLNIGGIEGGKATNIVPEQCTVTGEVRSLSHKTAMEQLALTRHIFEEEAARFGGEIELSHYSGCKAYATELSQPVVRRFEKACEELGFTPSLVKTFGGSDNNCLAQGNFQGIVLANAMNRCHSCEEYTTVEELIRSTALTLALMCSDE